MRRKILFFAESVTLSHVVRPYVLAASLNPNDYDVTFACDTRSHWLIKKAPFHIQPIHSIPSNEFLEKLAKGSPVYSADILEKYIVEDKRIISAVQPDLIVGDFRLSLSVSASKARIPYAAISNIHWSPYAHPFFPAPNIPLYRMMTVKMADRLFHATRALPFAYHARPLNQVRKKHGLPALPYDLRQIYNHADWVFYSDIPGLILTDPLPAHHLYLGPVFWEPPVSLPAWWDAIPRDKPIIYVTLGSSGWIKVSKNLIQALGELPITVLLATAGRFDLDHVPPNVFASDFLPGRACAEIADVAITNGGCGSTPQVLSGGIPVLGITNLMDQDVPMQAIEKYGAGIRLRARDASKNTLKTRVWRLLEDRRYTLRAKELEDVYARYDACRRFHSFLRSVFDRPSEPESLAGVDKNLSGMLANKGA